MFELTALPELNHTLRYGWKKIYWSRTPSKRPYSGAYIHWHCLC